MPEEAAEIVFIIVYTNFELCILLLVTIIGLFMNDPFSLVSSTSHKKQLANEYQIEVGSDRGQLL